MEMANEDGNVADLTIEILQGIRSELQGLRAESRQGLAEVRAEVSEVRAEVSELRAEVSEVRAEVSEVRAELHTLAESTQVGFAALLGQGDRRFLDHEGRLRRLEEHTGLEPTRG
jgi:predicted nuclease with TOPRIM domain